MLEILYRDAALIAIHKPAGLLVHRSMVDRHEVRFAVQLLRDQIGQRVWPLHRLDKGTSGVLLFALDRDTASRMSGVFETGRVDKRYLAIVRGHPAAHGLIDHPLSRNDDPYAAARSSPDPSAPDALAPQSAYTRYATLARVELPEAVDRYPTSRYALVGLDPVTGRRHQLRRHLKHLSHPIIGDSTYGKGRHNRFFVDRFHSERLLLACVSMRLPHPYTGQRILIAAPPAPDFAAVIDALGWKVPDPAELDRCLG